MLTLTAIGCGAVTGEVTRPEIEADQVRTFLRDSCVEVEGKDGVWECEAEALAKAMHAMVDLKWDLIECTEDSEYVKKACLIRVEKLHVELSKCHHDPWCLGPITGVAGAVLGFILGLFAF